MSADVPDEIGAIYSLRLTVHELLNVDERLATEIFQQTKVSPYDCAPAAVMKRAGLRLILSADAKHFDAIPSLTRKAPLDFAKA